MNWDAWRQARERSALLRILFAGCWALVLAVTFAAHPARAQGGFDRPGGDYARFVVSSGDPAVCAARCERDARCRAWTFSYPGTAAIGGSNAATCWLKNQVRPLMENRCCVAGVKGAGLVESRSGPIEASTDRYGGDYRHFVIGREADVGICKKACEDDNRCRAWTYVRPGYGGSGARCYLKARVTPPRRKPCCMSGVVR